MSMAGGGDALSYARDIRPLFRQKDRDSMRRAFDLFDYSDVAAHVDAIVGVACLNVLEKAFDKILLSGIPCIATPLLSSQRSTVITVSSAWQGIIMFARICDS